MWHLGLKPVLYINILLFPGKQIIPKPIKMPTKGFSIKMTIQRKSH